MLVGGRMLETKTSPGAVLVGSRTIQEGGAFLSMTREDVELFCIDHLVMVDIITTDEALIFDFQTVTTPGPGGKVTGLEAVMQVAHIILTDFKYEEDAFERARQSFHEQFDSIVKGLESACQESIVYSLIGGDARYVHFCFMLYSSYSLLFRFLTPNHKQIDALDLSTVKNAIVEQLDPGAIEVSIAGDAPIEVLDTLALYYMGTVPPRVAGQNVAAGEAPVAMPPIQSVQIKTLGKTQQLGVYLPDSDERAMGYLAGPAPNRWGVYANGDTVTDMLKKKASGKRDERRENPLFGHVALLILQEVSKSFLDLYN